MGNYPDFEKVYKKNNLYKIKNPKSARLHRMSIGTIVAIPNGFEMGPWNQNRFIEESFISKLKKNDCFLFNGKYVQFALKR